LRCPICGDTKTRLEGKILICDSCGAIEKVVDDYGGLISDEVWNILLDARAVAKYLYVPPPGVE
jgi:hypothetical protein